MVDGDILKEHKDNGVRKARHHVSAKDTIKKKDAYEIIEVQAVDPETQLIQLKNLLDETRKKYSREDEEVYFDGDRYAICVRRKMKIE